MNYENTCVHGNLSTLTSHKNTYIQVKYQLILAMQFCSPARLQINNGEVWFSWLEHSYVYQGL
jgi:hypothetical protein